MYKVGEYVVIKSTKEIKVIKEIERFENDVVIYTTDGKAHTIKDCHTVKNVVDYEVNKLLNKWKI